MKNTDLRRLSRTELLEVLVDLNEENERLREKNEQLQQQLEDKNIAIGKAGSIAEAALALSGVFSAAEKAAEQYLENIKRLSDGQKARCAKIEQETIEKAKLMMARVENECRERERKADLYVAQREGK